MPAHWQLVHPICGWHFCGDQLLITGELLYVYANPATQTSLPVPQSLRDIMLGFEAGEPVTTAHIGTWDQLQEAAQTVRTEVFVQEQRIAPEDEWDAADASALHVVLNNRYGVPMAPRVCCKLKQVWRKLAAWQSPV